MQTYDEAIVVKNDGQNAKQIWESLFQRAAEKFGDDGKPLTPWTLVCEMFSKVPEKKGKCLIIGDFNLLHYAVNYGSFDEVWFVPVNSLMEGLAKFSGSMKEKVKVLPIEYNNLIESTKKELGDMKFDVIVGNPPYQKQSDNERASSVQLWPKFIECIASNLCENAYLIYVTPNLWLKNPKKYFCNLKCEYANINTRFLQAEYFPNIASTFSWYVLRNSRDEILPISIESQGGELIEIQSIDDFKLLRAESNVDSRAVQLIKKISTKCRKMSIPLQASINDASIYNEEKTETHIFPVCYSSKKSRRQMWSSIDHGFTGIPKLCMARISDLRSKNAEWFLPITECGAGWQMFYICMSMQELLNLKDLLLTSSIMKFVESATRYGRYTKVYNFIPDVDFTQAWDDAKLAKHFELTEAEIAFINELPDC